MTRRADESGPTAGVTRNRRADPAAAAEYPSDGPDATEAVADRSPAGLSAALAVGFAILAALTLPSIGFVLSGLVGAVLVAAGVLWGAGRYVGYGTAVLVGGVFAAGFKGAPPEPLVLRTLLALLAWDAGRYGIAIGRQLGGDAHTRGIELAHTAFAAAVGAAGAGLAYATYRVMSGGRPVMALLLMLFGAAALLLTVRDGG